MTTATLHISRWRTFQVKFVAIAPQVALAGAAIVICDILSLHRVIPSMVTIGGLEVDWTVLPAIAVVVMFWQYRLPRIQLGIFRAIALGIFVGLVGAIVFQYIHKTSGYSEVFGYLLLATKEEAIYRVALPVAFAYALCCVGLGGNKAFWAAILLAAATFATLPGHLAQMQRPTDAIAFFAFALVMSYFTWETRTLILAGVAHGASNIITNFYAQGFISSDMRTLSVFIMVVALLVALPTSEEIFGKDDDDSDAIVIDLRDHILAQHKAEQDSLELLEAPN